MNRQAAPRVISDFLIIGASGGIFQGTGTPTSPTTALKIYNSSGVGIIEMWKAGSKTFYTDSSGNVTMIGTITATAGAIGGWVIGAADLKDAAGVVGMSSAVTGGDDIRFWAGHATPASAPFKVTEAGVLTATSGAIGGWTIGATTISSTGVTITSGASASMAFGTTPPTSPTAGTGIYIDKTGLFGLSANVKQAYIDATGVLYAGAGNVILNANGIVIKASASFNVFQIYDPARALSNILFGMATGDGNLYLTEDGGGSGGNFYIRGFNLTLLDDYGLGHLTIENSIVVGAPTGGDKGAGTINAVGVYDDNVLLTDFVFEPDYNLLSIPEMKIYFEANKHLPTISGRDEWEKSGKPSLGKSVNQIWETAEVHARYIAELDERLTKLGG